MELDDSMTWTASHTTHRLLADLRVTARISTTNRHTATFDSATDVALRRKLYYKYEKIVGTFVSTGRFDEGDGDGDGGGVE